MDPPRIGRCHCGAVTVTVPATAFGVVACHCGDCQKMHGNYFAMIAAPTADVRLEGEEHIRWYSSSESSRRAFCEVCGSRIAKEQLGSGRLLLSIGLFGPTTGLRVRKNVYAASKPDWYPLPAED